MTATDEPITDQFDYMPRLTEWQQTEADVHGDFHYTLRQYLLMRRLNCGGEWTDVCNDVSDEIMRNYEWDVDARDTYSNWQSWYYGDRGRS